MAPSPWALQLTWRNVKWKWKQRKEGRQLNLIKMHTVSSAQLPLAANSASTSSIDSSRSSQLALLPELGLKSLPPDLKLFQLFVFLVKILLNACCRDSTRYIRASLLAASGG